MQQPRLSTALVGACLLPAAAALLPTPALAHADLERVDPPKGSKVSTPPHQLVLIFTEGVEPRFTIVQVRDPSGAEVPTGTPHTESGNNRKLVVQLPALGLGQYTVTWHATSVDTHKTEGSYQFTIVK